MHAVHLSPSILSADFTKLRDEIQMCEAGGADSIHIDVMDGRFVPNLTYGAKIIDAARRSTSLPLDVHLMVVDPEQYFESFMKAGATGLTIHAEATAHLQRHLVRIRELGGKAGVALNPATPLAVIGEVTADLDLVLIMTVNPGFGGQSFIPASLTKIARARGFLDAARCPADLQVDGGIDRETIVACRRAGADVFVAGNAIFTAPDPQAEIGVLRDAANAATVETA